jgi:hypothetical protein
MAWSLTGEINGEEAGGDVDCFVARHRMIWFSNSNGAIFSVANTQGKMRKCFFYKPMSHPKIMTEYNDEYPTCVETFSTLRVFSDQVDPERITKLLAIEPTESFRMGEARGAKGHRNKAHGWFYSTEGISDSRDTRRHIDLILDALNGRTDAVHLLQKEGCRFDICSYWDSIGHGGPSLLPHQMARLAELEIEIWWDVYFSSEDEK